MVLYNTCLECLKSCGFVAAVRVAGEMEGVDVNQADGNGTTPLSIAAFNGHANVVQLLLEAKGMDVNQTNNWGETAIFYAAQKGHLDVLQVLLGAQRIEIEPGRTGTTFEKGGESR